MMIQIAISLIIFLCLFLAYVATRKGTFHYEVTEEIQASPEKIFPYLSELKLGREWTPFAKNEPSYRDEVNGQVLTFTDKGSAGSLEIIRIVPNERVELRLRMTKPVAADNLVVYSVVPTSSGTRMTWSMSGDGGYFTKLITVFMDVEKMMTDQFKQGFSNLRTIVE